MVIYDFVWPSMVLRRYAQFLCLFFHNFFEYSEAAEYSVAEISAGPACVLIGNLMYLSRRENSKIWNLKKLKGCDAKK